MAVPKRKTSRQRRDTRRSTHVAQPVAMTRCTNCGAPIRPHHVCGVCGQYRGKQRVEIEG